MFKMKNLVKRLPNTAVFLLLGAGLPAMMTRLFGDREYLDVFSPLHCLFIVAYIMHFPLYHRM